MIADPAFWLLFAAAAVGSALLTAPVRQWLLYRRMLDLPDSRRSHDVPTPRGGGLAIVSTLMLAWLCWPGGTAAWWQSMIAVIGMALVGWFEDRVELAARWRFLAQILVAVWLVAAHGGVASVDIAGATLASLWLWSGLAVIGVVWLINLFNFMDGADGLAAVQGLWVGLVFAGLFALSGSLQPAAFAVAAAGAWGGFLFWNRPPAGIFMGDVGSLALGASVAAMAVVGAAGGTVSIWVSFMVSSVFVVDATATLLSRVRRGERWYTAHRQHAYQRLLDRGWSHGQVMGLYLLVNLFIVLPGVVVAVRWPHFDTVLAAGLAVLLAVGWRVVQSAAKSNNDKASV